jgi:hypothetical protein
MHPDTGTWHYGVVAQWWAEFNVDGPEVDYFKTIIQRYGEPALDVACGTGRLLLPYLRAGLDVDGCDVETLYFPAELALMLERADFHDIRAEDGYTGATPARDSDVIVFIARKP